MDSINKKISNGLVKIERKESPIDASLESVELSIEAIICCPLCSELINVLNDSRRADKFSWDTTNFDWHIENVHLELVSDLASDDNIETNVQGDEKPDYVEAESFKLHNSPVACSSNASVNDEERQGELHSEIVIGREIKEPNEQLQTSQDILNSMSVENNVYSAANLHGEC